VSSEGPDVPRVSASLGSRDVRILDWKEGLRECDCDVIGVDCCYLEYLRRWSLNVQSQPCYFPSMLLAITVYVGSF